MQRWPSLRWTTLATRKMSGWKYQTFHQIRRLKTCCQAVSRNSTRKLARKNQRRSFLTFFSTKRSPESTPSRWPIFSLTIFSDERTWSQVRKRPPKEKPSRQLLTTITWKLLNQMSLQHRIRPGKKWRRHRTEIFRLCHLSVFFSKVSLSLEFMLTSNFIKAGNCRTIFTSVPHHS